MSKLNVSPPSGSITKIGSGAWSILSGCASVAFYLCKIIIIAIVAICTFGVGLIIYKKVKN